MEIQFYISDSIFVAKWPNTLDVGSREKYQFKLPSFFFYVHLQYCPLNRVARNIDKQNVPESVHSIVGETFTNSD